MEAVVTGFLQPDVRVFPDLEGLSRAAADCIVRRAEQCMQQRGRFTVAVSGGSTPRRLYSLLAAPPYCQTLPWPGIHVFWCDERCVPPDRPESNYRMALDTVLSHVPVPAGHIHRIRGEDGPVKAARLYEDELTGFFGTRDVVFDLVILGAGEDGHTASLFPGSPALKERKRLAVPVVPGPRDIDRVTLTLPVLNRAGCALFLVAGAAKSGIVHEIIEDGNPRDFPAGLVRSLRGCVSWMLDSAAASQLMFVALKGAGRGGRDAPC
jgi:6-phosphogluconolactonase